MLSIKEYIYRHRKALLTLTLCLLLFQTGSCLISRTILFHNKASAARPRVGQGQFLKVKNQGRIARGYLSRQRSRQGKKLVVLFHGQRGSIYTEAAYARRFYYAGFSTLLVEYPGYGISRQEYASEANIYSDAQALLETVSKKYGFRPQNIYAWGRSLGSGVAAEMGRRGLVGKLILVTPYTSIPAVAHYKYVPVLPYLLMGDRFSTWWKANDIKLPVLLIHGKKDKFVPYYMSEELHQRFPHSRLMSLPGAHHFNIYAHLNATRRARIFQFLRRKTRGTNVSKI